MFQRILVPLDGSKYAELAIVAAARLARASAGSLILTHIVPSIAEIANNPEMQVTVTQDVRLVTSADNYLDTVKQRYVDELANTKVEVDVVEVDATSTGILSATNLEQVDLIVMCVQEETFFSHWLFRHIPRHAIRRSTVPVLLLNECGKLLNAQDIAHPFHVLIPLDGSALAEAILEPVAQLLAALTLPGQQVIVQLLDVIDDAHIKGHSHNEYMQQYEHMRDEAVAYLKTVAERIERDWRIRPTVISSILLNSEVTGTILRQAERVADAHAPAGCDLIAMSTHGRDGVQRLLHGSVTEDVLESSRFPLFVVTPALAQKHALPMA
jgi:nucleotide-binding universal stress UspA family protein